MATDSISSPADTRRRPIFYLEPAWILNDQLSLADRPSLLFNSRYVSEMSPSFDFRAGFGSRPDRFFRFNGDIGLGYSRRMTPKDAPLQDFGDLDEKRISIGLEPSFALPPKKQAHLILGLGTRGVFGLFTTTPVNTKGFCAEKAQGTCSNWEPTGGIPQDAQTDIELKDDPGYGYKVYGLVGLEFGSVIGFIFRGGYQELFFSGETTANYGGPLLEGALRVTIGHASSTTSASRLPAEPDPPARASEPDSDSPAPLASRSSPRRVDVDVEEEPEKKPPPRINPRSSVSSIDSINIPDMPVIGWENLDDETWQKVIDGYVQATTADPFPDLAVGYQPAIKEEIFKIREYVNLCESRRGQYSKRFCKAELDGRRDQYMFDYSIEDATHSLDVIIPDIEWKKISDVTWDEFKTKLLDDPRAVKENLEAFNSFRQLQAKEIQDIISIIYAAYVDAKDQGDRDRKFGPSEALAYLDGRRWQYLIDRPEEKKKKPLFEMDMDDIDL